MARQWLWTAVPMDVARAAKAWNVTPLIAQLLANRGHAPDRPVESFLFPLLKDLHPPEMLSDAEGAADLLFDAIQRKHRIILHGDYDVDGIMGVSILWHVLRTIGAEVTWYVPHRLEEGYGLGMDAVRRHAADGARLIVSVDCGINAVQVGEYLREIGVAFIVTDHHTAGAALPHAAAIVHPALGTNPNRDLCGAGVAFKLAWALAQRASGGERVSPELREWLLELLPLAALGTIADVVTLGGENRIIARHGLERLTRSKLPGVQALLQSSGLLRTGVTSEDVGYKLAPRINAAGRMGHARLAVELFTRADAVRAQEIAQYLEDHNRARQTLERRITREACERIENESLAADHRRAIVLASPEWHAGIIGIAAARVVDRFHRPTALIALSDGQGQGSARSIRHFDLARALSGCGEHLVQFGGHAMAAGFRITAERVPAFTEAFVDAANSALTGADLLPRLAIEAEVRFEELSLPVMDTINRLGPFGSGNARPRLATDWVELADEPRPVGRNDEHLQAVFRQNGSCMKSIGFGLGKLAQDLKEHRRCKIAFEPIINEYQGRRTVEMQILDVQFPT
jgi:single-stranded-DNA-specific exonuclease